MRVPFDVRDVLLSQHPDVFSVPPRFTKHMMVVADLAIGDDDAIEDAVTAAWRMQAEIADFDREIQQTRETPETRDTD